MSLLHFLAYRAALVNWQSLQAADEWAVWWSRRPGRRQTSNSRKPDQT
jgi:hypothetical protein